MVLQLFLSFIFLVVIFHLLDLILVRRWDLYRRIHNHRGQRFTVLVVAMIGIYAVVITGGLTSYLLVLLGLFFYGFHLKRNGTEQLTENETSLKFLPQQLILPSVVFLVLLVLKTAASFQVQDMAYFSDHYFYAKVANAISATGMETYNVGYSMEGLSDFRPYHYLELYFSTIMNRITGLPTVMVLEYVFLPLAVYLILLSLVQKVSKANILAITVAGFLVLFLPTLIKRTAEFASPSVIVEIKLLVVMIFVVQALVALRSGRIYEFLFLQVMGALIYPTILFNVGFTIAGLLVYEFWTGGKKLANRALLKYVIAGAALLIFLLFIKVFEQHSNSYTKVEGLSSSFIKSYLGELYRLLRVIGVAVAFALSPHFILGFLLSRKWERDKGNKLIIWGAMALIGGFIIAGLFKGVADGTQLITNFARPFAVGLIIMFVLQIKNQKAVLALCTAMLLYVGLFFKLLWPNELHPTQIELSEEIAQEDWSTVGVVRSVGFYNQHHNSNTRMTDVGQELGNFSNIHLVNITPIDELLASELVDPAVKDRLAGDQMYIHCQHNSISPKEYINNNIDAVISNKRIEDDTLYDQFTLRDSMMAVKDSSAYRIIEYVPCYLYTRQEE